MQAFHAELARQSQLNPNLRLHYVTAWEMAQLVRQAEAGATFPELSASTRFRIHPFTRPSAGRVETVVPVK